MTESAATETVTPPRARLWERYAIVLGIVLYALVIWVLGWDRIREAMSRAEFWPVLGMAALTVLGFWVRATKWRYVLGPGSGSVSLFFLSKFAGNWTPGRVGELSPLLLRRFRTPRVALWIIFDRVLEIAVTLAFGLAAAVGLGFVPPWTGATLFAGGIMLIALSIIALRHRAWSTRAMDAFPEGSRRRRLFAVVAQLHEEMFNLGYRVPAVTIITVFAKCLDIFAVQFLCAGFGFSGISFLLVCAARCAHALVSALPVTPDASGVPFVAAAWLLHEYGGMPYEVLAVALGLEVAIINGVLWAHMLAAATGLRARGPLDKA